jgi:hypothetical protein
MMPQKLKIKSQGAYETWIEGNKAFKIFFAQQMKENCLGPTRTLIRAWL